MTEWNEELCIKHILDYEKLKPEQKDYLKINLNKKFTFDVYEKHRDLRYRAFENEKRIRQELSGAKQFYPELVFPGKEKPGKAGKCAVVLTAGGEGERLRVSLEKMGYDENKLKNFTKATFALPDFNGNLGTLQINLILIAHLGKKFGTDIPVIVTTGPEGSTTAEIIPRIIKKNNNFGLKHIIVVHQHERLHLTKDDKVAWYYENEKPVPVTHPDETGGPLMSLKSENPAGITPLEWLTGLRVEKILVLQATALYNPDLISAMANADDKYDCVGVGILRELFPADDPFGTYVGIDNKGIKKVVIIEQNVRDKNTREIKSSDGKYFLPYNTGFYAFKKDLLENAQLPDFATPPKEILPGLERTPKVGYAATDLIRLADMPAVLAVTTDWFAVLKNADNLNDLTVLGKACGLDRICAGAV